MLVVSFSEVVRMRPDVSGLLVCLLRLLLTFFRHFSMRYVVWMLAHASRLFPEVFQTFVRCSHMFLDVFSDAYVLLVDLLHFFKVWWVTVA